MFDFTLAEKVPYETVGTPQPNDYFLSHFDHYEKLVLDKLLELGMDPHVWSLLEQSKRITMVHFAVTQGRAPNRINLPMDMEQGTPEGKFHPHVVRQFEQMFPHSAKQFFFFTKAEDWWDGDPLFLVSDADSFMQWCRYDVATREPDTLHFGEPRKRGRPRNEAAHAAKADKSARYRLWLQECEAYRARVISKKAELAEARLVVEQRRLELQAIELEGAPKWNP